VVYGSLDNPIAKLGRAAEHFRGIRDLIGGFDHQAIPLRVDRHQGDLSRLAGPRRCGRRARGCRTGEAAGPAQPCVARGGSGVIRLGCRPVI
jgi:hypothetical protein